jgi:hypothetical protein
MSEPNPELEPDAPDWSNEPASDEVLAEQLREKGVNMTEMETPEVPGVPVEEGAPEEPGVPVPDTSPPEEQNDNGGEEENEGA